MAQCSFPECDKSLPGDDVPACSSCLLRPLSQAASTEIDGDSEKEDVGFDLSYLNEKEKEKTYNHAVMNLHKLAHQEPVPLQEMKVVKMKVRSNSIRSRAYTYDGLDLHFDAQGVAEFADHELYKIKKLMRVRPGRFTLIEEKPNIFQPGKPLEEKLKELREKIEAVKPEETPEEKPPVVEETETENSLNKKESIDVSSQQKVSKKQTKKFGRKKSQTKKNKSSN